MKKIVLICVFLSSVFSASVVAAPLDNIFKDVEVSGTVRYRYESSSSEIKSKNSKSSTRARTDITIQ